jgi:hypothetical protein
MRHVAPLVAALLLALGGCAGGVRSRPDPAPLAPSAGPTLTVPDVRGLALGEARATLETAGLSVGIVEPWPDSLGYAAGTVVAQRPARGTSTGAGTPIDLRVYGISEEDARREMAASRPLPVEVPTVPPSAPPAPPPPPVPPAAPGPSPAPAPGGGLESSAIVPDLVGLSLEEAARVARAAGFEVVPLRVAGHPPGQVVSQDLGAGRSAPLGSPIGIRVGK